MNPSGRAWAAFARYLGRPEETRLRFAPWRGRRVYRTGDQARRRPDGALELLGRGDAQVKVHDASCNTLFDLFVLVGLCNARLIPQEMKEDQ